MGDWESAYRQPEKKRGLTQEDLSGITCLHRTHIARLERGELNPSFCIF